MYVQECAVHVSYFLCCCFSCRHVSKERFSREVLQNENSNEVSRQSLRKCVRIFARILRSAHFRSLRGPNARTPWPDLTNFPTAIHFAFPACFASKVAKVRAKFRTSWRRTKVCTHFRFAEPLWWLICFIWDESMSWCGLESSFAVEEIYSYVYWRNNCIHWL